MILFNLEVRELARFTISSKNQNMCHQGFKKKKKRVVRKKEAQRIS